MTSLQALIFDVDGTLADTERDGHRVAFNRAFADAGLDWDWSPEVYGELLSVTGGKERIRYFITQYHPEGVPSGDLQDWIAGLHASKTKYYTQLLSDGHIPLRPGVRRLIQEAREQGMRLAIATTTTPDNVFALLEAALAPGSPDWFEVIAAGDIVPAKKPAPDIFHYALKRLELEPQECLVFEDSGHGVDASHQAGLPTVVTVNSYTHNQDFSGAALILNHLGEPDQPFEVMAGEAGQATYFDLALAKELHQRAIATP
ncbi:HAD family hydrolase [Oculatella sp. LEGE 06141]|uniref:HAD family hydrolase n=1 Tax=Oculatella sp. LEGE 06141 TaxID=1828648 RepID=UPI0018827F6F|nr:HAD family hydrolase [Oculatella sp. LEGE 06141]MBE9180463.1 HAD family hydrolase [Oculatella sp. LEGE 06141]